MRNLVFIYKCSHGELHAGLPILLKIKEERKDVNLIFAYTGDAFQTIPSYYKPLIESNFNTIRFSKVGFLRFYLSSFKDELVLFTCDSGHTLHSLFLTLYSRYSRVVFFHHAYALHGSELDPRVESNIHFYKRRLEGFRYDSLCIAHNEQEVAYREKLGFKLENIIVAGNIGYQEFRWHQKLMNLAGPELSVLQTEKIKFKKTVFIPVRGVHESALSSENADYLFLAIKAAVSAFPDYLFLIKLHPRQADDVDFVCLSNENQNVRLVTLNPITASSISDLVISYYSSAISDCLVANKPVVEFYRHKIFHGQLVQTENGLVSLYHYLSLCPFIQSRQELFALLSSPDSWDKIRESQQVVFSSIYMKVYPDFVNELFERLESVDKKRGYFYECARFPLSVFNGMIVSRLRKIFKYLSILRINLQVR